jgi:hypothetical protein
MMRVFYGMGKGNAHRDQCRGDDAHVGAGLCIGIGGVRIESQGGVTRMARRSSDHVAIEAEIDGVRSLGLDELRALWRTSQPPLRC